MVQCVFQHTPRSICKSLPLRFEDLSAVRNGNTPRSVRYRNFEYYTSIGKSEYLGSGQSFVSTPWNCFPEAENALSKQGWKVGINDSNPGLYVKLLPSNPHSAKRKGPHIEFELTTNPDLGY
ncbi:hypothetical protein Trydic_g15894 [Trypoxylus dichotomus]